MNVDEDRRALDAARQLVFDSCTALSECPGLPTLKPDINCRGPVPDPFALLMRLQEDFTRQVLVGAGLLERHDAAGLILSHALYDATGLIVALRPKPCDPPADLLTLKGALSGRLAILAALCDCQTRRRLRKQPYLLVTGSVSEVVFLRAVGLAATLSADIVSCRNFPQLRRMASFASDSDEDNGEDARLTQPVDPRASAVQDNWIPMKTTAPGIADSTDSQQSPKQRPALVLVGWEILNRSTRAPKELFALIAYLVELQDHLGLDFADVRVWLPSAGLPADLAFAAKFNDARLLRSLFVQSIESESRFLWEFTTNPGSLARLAERNREENAPESRGPVSAAETI